MKQKGKRLIGVYVSVKALGMHVGILHEMKHGGEGRISMKGHWHVFVIHSQNQHFMLFSSPYAHNLTRYMLLISG